MISVELVLEMLAAGAPFDEVIETYPHLTREDILACLAFAAELLAQLDHAQPGTERLAG